jgi:hypothetical protein
MALNIDIVNTTVINVYETGGVPRSYFGATGASGKFYPSGTSGSIIEVGIISDATTDLVDSFYEGIEFASTSGNGFGQTFQISVVGGLIEYIQILNYPNPDAVANGFSLGDTIVIDGSSMGGLGTVTIKVIELAIDGLLISIGGDFYETKWNNLVVGGTSPTSLSDAQSLLATLFSTL